jgi:hypothetical protein
VQVHPDARTLPVFIWAPYAIPGAVGQPTQDTSQVLRLSTAFPYEVLSLSTKHEVPCSLLRARPEAPIVALASCKLPCLKAWQVSSDKTASFFGSGQVTTWRFLRCSILCALSLRGDIVMRKCQAANRTIPTSRYTNALRDALRGLHM